MTNLAVPGRETLEGQQCHTCKSGDYEWSNYCGAYVCRHCNYHYNLVRCYCGWSLSGGDGRQELEEMGETIDSEEPISGLESDW